MGHFIFYICSVNGTKRAYWFLQVAGWLSYGILITLFTYLTKSEALNSTFMLKVSLNVVLAIGLTHAMRAVFVQRRWLELTMIQLLPRIIFLSAVFAAFLVIGNRTFSYFVNSLLDGGDTFRISRILVDWLSNLVLILFWNSVYFSYSYFTRYYYQEINNLTIESSLRETELKNLRSQLNPHFLFNSLNSIKALIEIDPVKAKDSFNVLSNILRSSLQLSKEGMIPLKKEVELVENYLKIEKIRFEERLNVVWDISEEHIENINIPPFVLQMMVENAVKHGISNLVEGGKINIVIKQNDQGLMIQVKNSGQMNSNEETFGIGLENTKRRLDLQYQNRASIHLFEEEDMVVSQILLKN